MKRILCLLSALLLLSSFPALAETRLYDPVAVVSYDRIALEDWTPDYGLNAPGVLLELSHAEGLVSITAVDSEGASPDEWLESRLDLAGETLSVSDAQITDWADPFRGDGRLLSFSYAYPDGDETHLARLYVSSWEDDLIEISLDTWGTDAPFLMDSAISALAGDALTLNLYKNAYEVTATLTDVLEGDDSLPRIQLTVPSESSDGSGSYYPLSADAVVLFPHPDDPAAVYPVAPDMPSLVDAILTYEESSDSPAVFRTILKDGAIVYMEYSLVF